MKITSIKIDITKEEIKSESGPNQSISLPINQGIIISPVLVHSNKRINIFVNMLFLAHKQSIIKKDIIIIEKE